MEENGILLMVAVLLVKCVAMATVTNINTDQSALLALKAHITLDPLNTLATNWTTSPASPCNWVGVICSHRRRRVTGLVLPDMGLMGTLPPHIGNLSFLHLLNLRNNSFHGSIPPELGRLRRLQSLTFSSNLFNGSIPEEMGMLQTLRVLSITQNLQLSGSIPRTLFNISSLQVIMLINDSLSGGLPEDICRRLPNLRSLYLNSNKLDGLIPSGLQECSQLQYLALSYNRFSGAVPTELGNLTMLKMLYLGGNDLKGEIPQELGNLPHLDTLTIEDAGLTGPIPSSIFNISSLNWISIFDNELTGSIPREMVNCTSLTMLYFGGNNLTGEIPEEINNLGKLEKLSLHYNNLEGPIPATIFNMSTLQFIALAGNSFFGHLPPTLGLELPDLEYLYLGENHLSGTIPEFISNASKLTVLALHDNQFSGSIPHSLGNLGVLEYLVIGLNDLNGDSSTPELSFITSLANCRRLSRLWFSRNPLNGVLPASIGNFSSSLVNIDASNCGIRGNIPKEIGNLSSLIALNLKGNKLSGSVPTTVKNLWRLQIVHLDGNRIGGPIPDEFCHLESLGLLHLSENKFSGSVPVCLGNMSSLRILSLASNKLTSSIPTSLWSLKDLLSFNLSSNSLSGHLPPGISGLKVATEIDLSMNEISGDIPEGIGGLQQLTYLSLAHNALQGPIADSLGELISLNFLDISYNNLSGVIPKSLEAILYLQYFNASFNRLVGEIPSGGPFANFTHQSFISNKALCGSPQFQVPPCHKRSKSRTLLLVYILVPIASILVSLTCTFALIRWRKRETTPSQTELLPKIEHERISYHELIRATDGLSVSSLLGTGSFGSVYKGTLANGTILAVKVFNLQHEGALKSFHTECEMLRNIRHRNLTKVISSCSNLDFKAIVLEYMPNGSLDKWLYSHNYFLDILQRLNIMIDVASALVYLHNGCSTPLVHCDLKPSNVLLDDNMVAHVSDFGIAKLLGEGQDMAQTKTLATFGYIAPEYGREGLVSTRCDVYSYGIVLMETFTRTKPTDEKFAGDLSLKHWVSESLSRAIVDVIDSNLLMPVEEQFNEKVECISSIMELALKCCADSPEERINMREILAALEKIRKNALQDSNAYYGGGSSALIS